jgi:hypothetical protein
LQAELRSLLSLRDNGESHFLAKKLSIWANVFFLSVLNLSSPYLENRRGECMNIFRNMNVGIELGVLIIIALFSLGIVGGIGYYYLQDSSTDMNTLYADC